MMTQFATLTPQAHVDEAVQTLLRTSQSEFPVVDGDGKPVGLLGRSDLIRAVKERGPGRARGRSDEHHGADDRPSPLPRRGVPHAAGEIRARRRRGGRRRASSSAS